MPRGGSTSATYYDVDGDDSTGYTGTANIKSDGTGTIKRDSNGKIEGSSDTKRFTKTTNYANKISNYKITKGTATPKLIKNQKVGTINKLIIGPFRMNYAAPIGDVLVNSKSSNSDNPIEWATSYGDNADWKNNKNLPKQTNFYLRINNTNVEELNIQVKLNKIEWYDARCIVASCKGGGNQTSIMWALQKKEDIAKIEWNVEVQQAKLTINKTDFNNKGTKLNAEFAIFFESTSISQPTATTGWLGGDKDSVTYGNTWSNKGTFKLSNGEITLENLSFGRYYVVEVGAPSGGYALSEQPGYKLKSNCLFMTDDKWKIPDSVEWCIIGKKSKEEGFLTIKRQNGTDYTAIDKNYVNLGYHYKEKPENRYYIYNIKNVINTTGNLTINKTDEEGKNKLEKSRFKILVKRNDNNKFQWIKNGTDGYEYVDSPNDASAFWITTGTRTFKGLVYGTYYVYEVAAPTGYSLEVQDGYNITDKPTGYSGSLPSEDFVYPNDNQKTMNERNRSITFNVKNKGSLGQLIIKKTDSVSGEKLNGAKFKILVKRENGTFGWLKELEDGKYDYDAEVSDATEFTVDGSKTINGLIYATYLIYETKAPDGYELSKQYRYSGNGESRPQEYKDDLPSPEYAYPVKSKKIDKDHKSITFNVKNKKEEKTTLSIVKKDEATGEVLEGVGFKILGRKDEDLSWGWLQSDGELKPNITDTEYDFITDENGTIDVANIPLGKYFIYETYIPEGYRIQDQKNNSIDKPDIGRPETFKEKFLTTPYVYYGERVDITTNSKNQTVEMSNKKIDTSLTLIKIDPTYNKELKNGELYLENAHIKIFYEGEIKQGWIGEEYSDEEAEELDEENNGTESENRVIEVNGVKHYLEDGDENAIEFITDNNGKIEIKGIPLGNYKFYETEAPEGYELEFQDGYDEEKEWVVQGEQNVSITDNKPEVELTNIKPAFISGNVWLDNSYEKIDSFNDLLDTSKYDENNNEITSGDELLDDIKVQLYKGSTLIAEELTSNGSYTIYSKNRTENPDEKISYWELPYCHVEFVYDNKEYVVVTPFKDGEDKIANNSKAQPKEIKITGGATNLDEDRNNRGEIYDGNLGGTDTNSEFYGSAITYNSGDTTNLSKEKIAENANLSLNQRFLTGFYNEDTYTVENINLGLIKKVEPSFDVGQELEFVKIVKGNYSFTYQYGKNFVVDVNNEGVKYTQDMVAFEKIDRTFTQYIYPSDIAYNFTEERAENDKYEVYVVYKVMISNNTTYNLEDLYKEYTLRLTNLSYEYDSTKYQLDNKDIGYENSGYTGTNEQTYIDNIKNTINNWNEADNNKLEWDLSNKNRVRAGHVGGVYVQFKVKDEALNELLQSTDGKLPEIKTKAIATGYHIYNRKEKTWARTSMYSHFTEDDTKQSSAYGFGLQLKPTRTISGSIFEDSKDEERANERIGNGVKDDGENRISDVVVSLIDASNNEVAKLYDRELEQEGNIWKPKSQDATILVGNDGTYNLQGVVPGRYYLRFTYGNGDIKLKQLNGEEITKNLQTTIWYKDKDGVEQSSIIKSNLYKSTILTGEAKNVNESNEKTWFLKNGQGSIAVDNQTTIDDRINPSNESVELNHSTLEEQQLINADSPNMNIQFEGLEETYIDANIIDTIQPISANMNFGIIERPKVDIQLDKNIKNVKFTLQNGTTIINGNPNDQNVSSSLSSWAEQEEEFNSTAKIELDNSLLYGSDISVSYEMVAHNESEVDYATENYYKYGIPGNSEDIVKTAVTRIVDYIDNGNAKYNISSDNITLENLDENKYLTANAKLANKNIGKKVFVAKGEGEKIGKLLTPSVKAQDGSDRETYEITVSNLLSNGDELFGWENYSEIIGIRNRTITPQSTSHFGSLEIKNPKTDEQDDANATIILTSSTGENRNLTIYYIIAGAFIILAIGTAVILIKNKHK